MGNRRNQKSRENSMYKYIYAKDNSLLPTKESSDKSFRKFLKKINIIGVTFWLSIGGIFGSIVDNKILNNERSETVTELNNSVKDKIDNMKDDQFYALAKSIVQYQYNLENPEAPISSKQVEIGIDKGVQLKKMHRNDGTAYFYKISEENGNRDVLYVKIKDPEEGIYTIKTIEAARDGIFGTGKPIDVYESKSDDRKQSFLTTSEYVYDSVAYSLTIYDHKNASAALKYRQKLKKELPDYYIDMITYEIKNESEQVSSERIEGITVNSNDINDISDKFSFTFDLNSNDLEEPEEPEELDR